MIRYCDIHQARPLVSIFFSRCQVLSNADPLGSCFSSRSARGLLMMGLDSWGRSILWAPLPTCAAESADVTNSPHPSSPRGPLPAGAEFAANSTPLLTPRVPRSRIPRWPPINMIRDGFLSEWNYKSRPCYDADRAAASLQALSSSRSSLAALRSAVSNPSEKRS